jgi:hypothetical protein
MPFSGRSIVLVFGSRSHSNESDILHQPTSPKHEQKTAKTYNSGYSLVVTHLTTNPPVRCLNRAERTGSLVFNVLWSYVKDEGHLAVYIPNYNITNQVLQSSVCFKAARVSDTRPRPLL